MLILPTFSPHPEERSSSSPERRFTVPVRVCSNFLAAAAPASAPSATWPSLADSSSDWPESRLKESLRERIPVGTSQYCYARAGRSGQEGRPRGGGGRAHGSERVRDVTVPSKLGAISNCSDTQSSQLTRETAGNCTVAKPCLSWHHMWTISVFSSRFYETSKLGGLCTATLFGGEPRFEACTCFNNQMCAHGARRREWHNTKLTAQLDLFGATCLCEKRFSTVT